MTASRLYFYDSIAATFDAIANPYDLQRRLEIVYDELLAGTDLAGKRLVDVGCGTGWFSQRATERGARVISLDIGQRLLHQVRAKCESKLLSADACALPFSSRSIDIVVSSECIEHTLDPLAAVREMARVLKPDGLLVLTTPNKVWRWSATLADVLNLRPYEGFEHWVSRGQLRRTLHAAGFQIDNMRGFHLIPPLGRPMWPILRRLDTCGGTLGPVMLNTALIASKRRS